MTKHPRDPHKWTNPEIQDDHEGYLEAQRAYREEQEKTRRRGIYAADEAAFTRQFVAAGGDKSKASQAFKDHRNKQAAQSAEQADQEAYTSASRRVRSVL